MIDFSKRLKELRVHAGLTQKQLAERIWVSKAAISNYELEQRNPAPEVLYKLSKVFNVSVDYLLGKDEKKQTLDVTDLTNEDIEILEAMIIYMRKKNFKCDK